MALQASPAVFELQEWEDEPYLDLPDYFLGGSEAFEAAREDAALPTNLQQQQHGFLEDLSDDFLEHRNTSGTPPPADFQKWQNELYDDLPDELAQGLEASLTGQYDFRPAPREANRTVTFSTWVDQDESGTHDPTGKALPIDIPLKRRREPRDPLSDGAPKRAKTLTYQNGRFNGFQLPLKLTFTSDAARVKLRSFGDALDNWPEPIINSQSTDQCSYEWPERQDQFFTDGDFTSRELRRRSRRQSSELQHFDGDEPCELADITLGFPAARGCKWCNALGDPNNPCPLLQEGAKYPCSTCKEDNVECELITEPVRKRACEACGRRRVVCSYLSENSDHSLPCRDCANAGIKCVAGPASGRTRTGPALDQGSCVEESSNERPNRNRKSCTACLNDKKWCSVKNKHGMAPCNYCIDKKIDCTSVPARRTVRDRVKRSKAKKAAETKEEPEKAFKGPETGNFMTIRTKLAHPINFNYMSENPDEPMPCHWCDDAVYGLLGLGDVDAEVVDNGDGQGYTEIVDGHVAAGYPPSRMCGFCTLDRLQITACEVHEIFPIDGMDPDNFDHEAAKDFMLPGMASSAPFAWCSVCPYPAFFACCKKMEDMGYQQDEIAEGEEKGCGLFLCEPCAATLVNDHGGRLQGLLDILKLEEGDGSFVLRADADFLHPNGELLRRMAAA